jgi:hypothetical protein
MKQPLLTLVAGLAGAGKTAWILEQIAQAQTAVVYSSLGSQTVPIDAVRVQAEGSRVRVIAPAEIESAIAGDLPIYLEIGAHLDIQSLDFLQGQRIAIASASEPGSEYHRWADQVIPSATAADWETSEIWQAPLSGQVLDPASLNVFWYELTEGAYGQVHRAKAIFDVADGRCFQFNFVAGLESDYLELPFEQCLTGRPNRFSGIEVVGMGLNRSAIAQTIQICCLNDQVLAHYQEQLKATLGKIPEEALA